MSGCHPEGALATEGFGRELSRTDLAYRHARFFAAFRATCGDAQDDTCYVGPSKRLGRSRSSVAR